MPQSSPKALMFQGTGSDVGKSLLVAGLARAFTRQGLKVAPFKPQNMSNNAAVTADGGEIGRAQALQARACNIPASLHMNPVLLKPQTDIGAQVVVQGKVLGNAGAKDYHALKPSLLPRVLESFRKVGEGRDLVLIEGAGSAAEVNLRSADIANMGFAEAADIPVVLVADIDRGGVIASLVGTHALLPETERKRIKGFIINKFRGDPALFLPAIDLIEQRTGWKGLGIVPWFPQAARLPAEDAASLKDQGGSGKTHIVVPQISRIANFDDFDPLAAEEDVRLEFVPPGRPLPAGADLIILPGSKATIADLAFLRAQGWDIDILSHARQGGAVMGICAGYQMLGLSVSDPQGIEGEAITVPGLGLLAVDTVMAGEKTLCEVEGEGLGQPVRGYEMHMGVTRGPDRDRPLLILAGQPDGAQSADGSIIGCYLHGVFASDEFRRELLARLQPSRRQTLRYEAQVDESLNLLGEHISRNINLEEILRLSSTFAQQ